MLYPNIKHLLKKMNFVFQSQKVDFNFHSLKISKSRFGYSKKLENSKIKKCFGYKSVNVENFSFLLIMGKTKISPPLEQETKLFILMLSLLFVWKLLWNKSFQTNNNI